MVGVVGGAPGRGASSADQHAPATAAGCPCRSARRRAPSPARSSTAARSRGDSVTMLVQRRPLACEQGTRLLRAADSTLHSPRCPAGAFELLQLLLAPVSLAVSDGSLDESVASADFFSGARYGGRSSDRPPGVPSPLPCVSDSIGGQEVLTVAGNHRQAATDRLGVARGAEATAADELEAVRGTSGEFHADVQLRAAEAEVSARSAWLAWTDEAEDG